MSFDFHRLEQVLAGAAARSDPAERGAYLAQACGEDRELRVEVERLLAANEQAGDFLESPAIREMQNSEGGMQNGEAEAIGVQAGDTHDEARLLERPGTRIGHYKLLEEIGEGAFGVVYMAEQLEPVQRKVALKIIKAGMDTREVVARFEAERQALALMDHPNIAKVFDGGVTQAGRPYFVMELVQGISITEFCDKRNLATTDRLQLFVRVCHAVQHAHQKGIIHRDLKPSNILVTLIDGQPVPKVIDFGVAKALGRKLTDKTLFTGFLKMVGTPAYMSPEQADLSGVDIDTRSDIYALGVLLYELLIGVTPFDTETLRNAALEEIRRLIRETEPPRPSTRLHTMGEHLTDVAKHRQIEPEALSRLVRGDLDWIVMKCLEKDRARRYETANSLAEDVQRHLDQQPVLASPPGAIYRSRKFLRRHRMGAALAGSVAVALIAALVVSVFAFAKVRQERDRALAAEQRAGTNEQKARSEADRSAQVARFMKDMLQGVGPSVAAGRDTTLLEEILDKTVARLGTGLTNQPAVEAELRETIGYVYWELGEHAKAESMYRRSLELLRRLRGHQHPAVADALNNLADVFRRTSQFEKAEAAERQAVAIYERAFGHEHPSVGASLICLGDALMFQGKFEAAEPTLREALAVNRKTLGENHPQTGLCVARLARMLLLEGRLAEAETTYRNAAAIQRRVLDQASLGLNPHVELAWTLIGLGEVLYRQGRLAEAETMAREALATGRTVLGDQHPDVLVFLDNLEDVLAAEGKLADLEPGYRELANRGSAVPLNNLARKMAASPDPKVRNEQNALHLAEEVVALTGRTNTTCLDTLAMAYAAVGRYTNAVTVQEEAIALIPDEKQKRECVARLNLYRSGSVYRDHTVLATEGKYQLWARNFAQAELLTRQCLAIRQKQMPDDWLMFQASSLLAAALLGQQKYVEAEPLLHGAYEGLKQRENQIPAQAKTCLKQTLERLVQLYEKTGRLAQADNWRQKLTEFEHGESPGL